MTLLDVSGLSARYETRTGIIHAVNDVSFHVADSEIVGIVGESGCGKSATVRSVLGLLRAPGRVTDGSVRFDGIDLLHLSRSQLRKVRGNEIGFVTQNPFGTLNPILSIGDQFRNVIRAHRGRVGRHDAEDLAAAALAGVGISGPKRVLDGHAHELSGGMAQRVVIALATLLEPKLVIGDEPTTALDVTLQRQILDLLEERVASRGHAMLLVTHDLGVVAQYCHRVVVMYAGKVVEQGPVDAVFKDPAHPYTRALLQSIPRRGEQIVPLHGRVADLRNYPKGCPFEPRCSVALDRCRTDPPALAPLEADPTRRSVSCHLTQEVHDVARAR